MEALQKKIVSVVLIVVFLIFVAVQLQRKPDSVDKVDNNRDVSKETVGNEEYRQAKTDLIFWYDDASYDTFFAMAAEGYFRDTGIKVVPVCKKNAEYMTAVYEKTMKEDEYPDVYLISGDCLEEAYLYGLVSVNDESAEYESAAKNAVTASTYAGKMFGYPLSYNTCLFIYQNEYFEQAPESMQDIIDYSNENEPGENVEYLVEWDVNDAFYDFPFISNSVTFEKNDSKLLEVSYDEEVYQQDLDFFESLLNSFSVNAKTVSTERILKNFKEGRTLCAIIDTDSLYELEGFSYSLTKVPDLNEELQSSVCAMTDLLVVNEFSKKQEQAADFAKYVTVSMADKLHETSGHYSVFKNENADMVEQTAYETYEKAILAPNARNARDFWVDVKETIAKYF